jgi:hypothetical protein
MRCSLSGPRVFVAVTVSFFMAVGSAWASGEWTLKARFGRLRVVVVDQKNNANESVYRRAAKDLCGDETFCDVMFWDDPAKAPASLPASNDAFAAQTAEWRQNLQTGGRELLIACRLVSNRTPCLPRY